MRKLIGLLFVFLCGQILAQPGWDPLTVAFAFYHEGVRHDLDDLIRNNALTVMMENEQVQLGSYRGKLCTASFQDQVSDPMVHVDTLWMQLGFRGEWMRIGFPPRAGEGVARYKAIGLRIDFKPGRFLVTDLPKELRVTGVVGNLDRIAAGNPFFDVQLRCGDRWSDGAVFDRATGRIDGMLSCRTAMIGRDEWVDLTLVTRNWYGEANTEMRIRARYAMHIDLGTFDLNGSRYYFDGRELRIDTAVPRDSIIATGTEGQALHIQPLNPMPTDTLRIEARWPGSGAPVVSSYTTKRRKGETLIRFSFAVRTDVNVAAESWTEEAEVLSIPRPASGHYRLSQMATKRSDLRDVDLLIGREVKITVGERSGRSP